MKTAVVVAKVKAVLVFPARQSRRLVGGRWKLMRNRMRRVKRTVDGISNGYMEYLQKNSKSWCFGLPIQGDPALF
jgi:hypothetical protein